MVNSPNHTHNALTSTDTNTKTTSELRQHPHPRKYPCGVPTLTPGGPRQVFLTRRAMTAAAKPANMATRTANIPVKEWYQ
ncbi:hypothetical protein HNP40_001140 [Mycobacteroides chelonae]|nr:hypothetical protein [Mycobacteroides chelonae]